MLGASSFIGKPLTKEKKYEEIFILDLHNTKTSARTHVPYVR